MGWQRLKIAHRVVAIVELSVDYREGFFVMHLNIQNVLERAIVGDASLRVLADLPGENDIPRRYRYSVSPEGIFA